MPEPAKRPVIAPHMSLRPSAASDSEYDLLIYGDIGESWYSESVSARSVVEQLQALDTSVVKTLNGYVNSYGGSVSDGLAIYNQLGALKAKGVKVLMRVDGVAMSIASLILMSGDEVEMPAASILMVHAPWGGLAGNAKEMRQYADVLDTYADAMANAYADKTGKDHADMLALLTDGLDHYYTGNQAKEQGFIDRISGAVAEKAPTESARAMAAGMLQRHLGRAPQEFAQMAITAALRAPAFAATSAAETKPAPPAPTPKGSTMPEPNKVPAPAAEPADRAAILAAEKNRRGAIRAHFARFEDRSTDAIKQLLTECEDDAECTPEAAGLKLLDALAKDTKPIAKGRVEGGDLADTKVYRESAALAQLHRYSPDQHKHTEASRQHAGMNLLDLARDCLARAGVNTRGLSRSDIAIRAMHSSSDFPSILENIVTKTLRAGYEATPRTFTPWARKTSLPDFKTISRAQLGGAPSLKKVLPGAQYKAGTIGDGAEKYRVHKYGRKIVVDWETIINDDLDALTRIPQAFGASAADLESDLVYAILTANAAMADSIALFHASHSNLGTAGVPSETTLSEARKQMTLQKGKEGRFITVRPEFILVPPSLETSVQKLLSAVLAAQTSNINVFSGSLTPIVEPRLEDSSATAWFLAANPARIDTVEYGYLEGHEGVYTETRNGFDVDGVEIKCRHVFGAKAIDFRGLFKNAGA